MQKSAVAAAVAACFTLVSQAEAADSSDVDTVVVMGTGATRSVTTLTPASLDVLPPGASLQKALSILPGVMAQSIDPLGVNEQSMTLQVRGFSTSHLGYTLDGMPLGDGSYNNYNGLSISRALTSENLGRADLATGIAGLGIASTSNLGGAVIYTSSAPNSEFGAFGSQTVGSNNGLRTFLRVDSGEYDGFSGYVSAQYDEQNLFVNQPEYNKSVGKQLNAKGQYKFDGGTITAFADLSDTNQADDAYMSKEMISRLGWDYGGYAPDWQSYVNASYCGLTDPGATPTFASRCVATPPAPLKASDARAFTNGQIIRDDALFYLAGDFAITEAITAHLQAYHHDNKGGGNNWTPGVSTQGTATTTDDTPVQIRDTRYTINRNGVLGNLGWDIGFNHVQVGYWYEKNISNASRYLWTNVTGPMGLGTFLQGQPALASFAQNTYWNTRQYFIQDTASLLDDTLTVDFGFKGTDAKSDAVALRGIAAQSAIGLSSQFSTGSLEAKDAFMPEAGLRWKIAPGHEVYASYAENMAMYQGGFKFGPQSVSQTVWNVQGPTLKPETSKSWDGGYRFIGDGVQVSLALYDVDYRNRLLSYNPCPTAQNANPGCNTSYHNAGSVTSKGVELGVQWQPLPWLSWYNAASLNQTNYNSDINWCLAPTPANPSGCVLEPTAGKQQVDTPKQLYSSLLTVREDGFFATLQGKFTGKRYYTYTNDQGFDAYTTFDLGVGFDFGALGNALKNAKISLNVTNLTDQRYAANFDNSVFTIADPAQSIVVAHASAPRQFFLTFSAAL